MTRNAVLYWLLAISSRMVPLLPDRLISVLGWALGSLAYCILKGPRGAIQTNLSQVMNQDKKSRIVRKAALEAFRTNALNWMATLDITHLETSDVTRRLSVDGWENLEEATRGGGGAILVPMHLGNFDYVGHYLLARGYKLTIPVERVEPPRLFKLLMKVRRSKGINVIPLDGAPRQLLSALKRGELVGLMGDRNIVGRGSVVDFFGRRALLPNGPVALARHSRVPLLVATAVRSGNNRFHGYISPPIPLQDTGRPALDDAENVQRMARCMEEYIGRFPEQWQMFAPVWTALATDQPDTIGHQNEATV